MELITLWKKRPTRGGASRGTRSTHLVVACVCLASEHDCRSIRFDAQVSICSYHNSMLLVHLSVCLSLHSPFSSSHRTTLTVLPRRLGPSPPFVATLFSLLVGEPIWHLFSSRSRSIPLILTRPDARPSAVLSDRYRPFICDPVALIRNSR
jgi:hypothetical protein